MAEMNRSHIKITHKDGHVTREVRKEFECVRLTQVYNRTAFEAGIIDVCVEWDDESWEAQRA
jgi:hypothetical protein